MNITLNIEAGNPGELHEAITGIAGIMGGAVAPQLETEKAKRVTKGVSKSDKQPDHEPVDQPGKAENKTEETHNQTHDVDSAKEVTKETSGSEDEEIPTVVDLRAKAQEKGGTPEGKKAIKALLDEFGSKSISDVPEATRAAFLQRLEAL